MCFKRGEAFMKIFGENLDDVFSNKDEVIETIEEEPIDLNILYRNDLSVEWNCPRNGAGAKFVYDYVAHLDRLKNESFDRAMSPSEYCRLYQDFREDKLDSHSKRLFENVLDGGIEFTNFFVQRDGYDYHFFENVKSIEGDGWKYKEPIEYDGYANLVVFNSNTMLASYMQMNSIRYRTVFFKPADDKKLYPIGINIKEDEISVHMSGSRYASRGVR
jgi:hypothetical protein